MEKLYYSILCNEVLHKYWHQQGLSSSISSQWKLKDQSKMQRYIYCWRTILHLLGIGLYTYGTFYFTVNTTFHLEHPVLWCSNYLVNDNKILKGIRNDGIPDPSSPSWTTQWSEATLGRVSALSWAAAIDTNKCAPASSQSSVVLLLISLHNNREASLVSLFAHNNAHYKLYLIEYFTPSHIRPQLVTDFALSKS